MIFVFRNWGCANIDESNFGMLVLGCMESDVCNFKLLVTLYSIEIRFCMFNVLVQRSEHKKFASVDNLFANMLISMCLQN